MNPDGTAAVGKRRHRHRDPRGARPVEVRIVEVGYELAGRWWCLVVQGRGGAFYAPLDRLEVLP